MARRATFTGLEPYKLTGVRVTDRELGHGSYATVLELECMGLKCAGKKIHELLLKQGGASYTVHRFKEECHLLSQVCHPNIVQFLGVYFQQGVRAPILVMEFLHNNLTSCIEQYGILPDEISYSILHDVALGLSYLHSQTPPIIHRDLSSNNVLLTPNMTAKISDLGVARILNLTPLQVSLMTQTPGTPAYIPPEVMIANPKYDTSVDEFSYGILMVHLFSGRWPEPQIGPNRFEGDRLTPVTEAERREVFLRSIGNDHPLMDLILKCINNDSRQRAHASEIVERLTAMTLQFPASFANRLEMLRCIQSKEEENRTLREEGERENQRKVQEMVRLRKEAQDKAEEIDRQNLVHSSEVEQLKLQVKNLNSQNQLLAANSEAEITELKEKLAGCEALIESSDRTMQHELEESEKQIAKLEMQMTTQKEEYEKERESCRKLMVENRESKSSINSLKYKNSMLEADTKRKESELNAKTKTLEEKEAIISGLNKQLTRTREHLSSKQHVLQARITWKQCADLPTEAVLVKTTVINSRVYCGGGGGGGVFDDGNEYNVYCYDPSQDNWTTLPPLPVKWFGLGQLNGKLVAVGGRKSSDDRATNKVYTYDEHSRKWKQTIPSMPTARHSSYVLSLQSALVVVGGDLADGVYINEVEIFKADTLQWYRTDPLPTACRDISVTVIGSTCYILGGHNGSHLNQALYASVDDLLHNAVPANQTTHSGSSDTQSAWKTLVTTPTYLPAAAVLAGNLLVIGGDEVSKGGADMKEVYMYSPSTNSWVYISDLPAPRSETAAAVLSLTEILVIGGYDGGIMNSVYKGTIQLKL